MYAIGQAVIVNDSAAEDLIAVTQPLLPLRGVIMGYGPVTQHDAPESERLVIVQMPEEFPGGHDCIGKAKARRGLYVTVKHVQPADYQTVPNVQQEYEQYVRDHHEAKVETTS